MVQNDVEVFYLDKADKGERRGLDLRGLWVFSTGNHPHQSQRTKGGKCTARFNILDG